MWLLLGMVSGALTNLVTSYTVSNWQYWLIQVTTLAVLSFFIRRPKKNHPTDV